MRVLIVLNALFALFSAADIPRGTATKAAPITSGTICAYSRFFRLRWRFLCFSDHKLTRAATCIKPTDVPTKARPVVSNFCQFVLHAKPGTSTTVKTHSSTTTTTVTPSAVTITSTATLGSAAVTRTLTTIATQFSTITSTVSTVATISPSTVTLSPRTFVNYPTRAAVVAKRTVPRELDAHHLANELEVRNYDVPSQLIKECSNKLPSVEELRTLCSCFLTSTVVTSSTTIVSTVTASGQAVTSTVTTTVSASTATITTTLTTTTNFVTSTTSVTTNIVGDPVTSTRSVSCGVAFSAKPSASTFGGIICAPVPAPSLNAVLRVEGNDSEGTIFEGCIVASPGSVTTSSGGTHVCDGTNNGANQSPGVTTFGQLAAAAQRNGFSFDGTWSSRYQDYFITSVGASVQIGDKFWGVLLNGQYTPVGACEAQVNSVYDRTLWAYDAFNKNTFLTVNPDWATAQAGQGSINVGIFDAMTGGPVSGASMAGSTSDNSGVLTITIPTTPGCYQYKATRDGALRSNTFYLNVVDQFAPFDP